MKKPIHMEPKIAAAAERQMRTWVQEQEIAERAIRQHGPQRFSAIAPFLAISREAGVGAVEIARLIGTRLGWEVLDKSLLDCVAQRFHVPRMMLDFVDETSSNWAYDVLGGWMDRNVIPHDKYIYCLTRVVWAAARRKSSIFVGRGASFILPREKGLAVRLLAPLKYRVEQIRKRFGLDATAARRKIEEMDRSRHDFVQQFFHHDVADPALYDLLINTETFGPLGTAEMIAKAAAQKDLTRPVATVARQAF